MLFIYLQQSFCDGGKTLRGWSNNVYSLTVHTVNHNPTPILTSKKGLNHGPWPTAACLTSHYFDRSQTRSSLTWKLKWNELKSIPKIWIRGKGFISYHWHLFHYHLELYAKPNWYFEYNEWQSKVGMILWNEVVQKSKLLPEISKLYKNIFSSWKNISWKYQFVTLP